MKNVNSPQKSRLAAFGAGALSHLKRWYGGEQKSQELENIPGSSFVFAPIFYTEYHWSAKIARALVGFYLRHWKWAWTTLIAVAMLYFKVLTGSK